MKQEILPGFFEIRTPLEDGFVNAYLALRGDCALLIDSGRKETASAVLALLAELGLATNRLRYLINTHSHPNHIGSNGILKTECGCEIFAHPEGIPRIENHGRLLEDVYDQFGDYWPVSDAFKKAFFDGLGVPASVDTPADFHRPFERPGFEDIQLIPLPGHQNDCLGVFFPKEEVLIVGDALQRRGIGPHFQQYDHRQAYLDSLQRIRELKPRWLLSGHFPPLSGTETEDFLNQSEAAVWEIDYRIATVKQQLGENAPLWDVALAVHEGMGKSLEFSGLLTIRAHLREEENPEFDPQDEP